MSDDLRRYLARQAKKGRLRGHDLALQLDLTSTFGGVVKARVSQKYLDAEYKLSHGIPLNIYDAARSYREKQGEPTRPLRSVLKDDRFRNAWGTFKGGYRWEYNREKREWVHKYKKEGGIYSTTNEKLQAARTLGWADERERQFERLKNISP